MKSCIIKDTRKSSSEMKSCVTTYMFAVVLVVLAVRFLLVKFLEAPFLEAFLVFGSFHSGFLNNFLSRLLLLAFCSVCFPPFWRISFSSFIETAKESFKIWRT